MPEPTFEDVPLSQLFPEDKLGWRGCLVALFSDFASDTDVACRYIEWEDKPDRKAIAKRILATKKFTPSPGIPTIPSPMKSERLHVIHRRISA